MLFDPSFPTFLIAHALGVPLAMALFAWRLRACEGTRRSRALVLACAMASGAVIGAFALGALLRLPAVARGRIELFGPGLPMAYGALAGATLATALAARRMRIEPLAALDALAPALGVLVMFGRAGCFFAGCCFGDLTTSPWAVTHPAGTPAFAHHDARGLASPAASASLPVHPTALYEVAVGALMLIAAIVLAKTTRRGTAFAAVAVLYAAGRFAVELYRGDPRPIAGPLSLPQWLSLLVVAAVMWLCAPSPAPQKST